MIKERAALLNTEETAFALRRALGSISAWHKTLECMRNDDYRLFGLQLLPATRINDGYGWRPQYDAEHIRRFIVETRKVCAAAASGKSVSVKRGDYDSNVDWRGQRTKIRLRTIH